MVQPHLYPRHGRNGHLSPRRPPSVAIDTAGFGAVDIDTGIRAMNRAADKIAIVTGAAGGPGRAHAQLWAKEGARVVATDRDESGGSETIALIERAGGTAMFIRHDVSSE